MNVKVGDLEEKIKSYMEGLKEGLTKLLEERFLGGDKVCHETHYENKRNVNHDFRDSKSRLKTNHIPKIDMKNFFGFQISTIFIIM